MEISPSPTKWPENQSWFTGNLAWSDHKRGALLKKWVHWKTTNSVLSMQIKAVTAFIIYYFYDLIWKPVPLTKNDLRIKGDHLGHLYKVHFIWSYSFCPKGRRKLIFLALWWCCRSQGTRRCFGGSDTPGFSYFNGEEIRSTSLFTCVSCWMSNSAL